MSVSVQRGDYIGGMMARTDHYLSLPVLSPFTLQYPKADALACCLHANAAKPANLSSDTIVFTPDTPPSIIVDVDHCWTNCGCTAYS